MKKFLALVALALGAFTTCQAQTFAISQNSAGGSIRLMIDRGNCTGTSRVIITTAPGGQYAQGCWFLSEDSVYVKYEDGSRRIYSIAGFDLYEAPKPAKKAGAM